MLPPVGFAQLKKWQGQAPILGLRVGWQEGASCSLLAQSELQEHGELTVTQSRYFIIIQ